MITLAATVLIASLAGSLHCAGMCGAFVAFAVGGGVEPGRTCERRSRSLLRSGLGLQCAYHGGRFVTYVLLGALCGSLGRLIDLGGSLAGVQRVAAVLAGAMMITFGLVAALRFAGVRIASMQTPQRWQRLILAGHRLAVGLRPMPRAAIIGLLTTLLPCGWLYAFAITAAGTADPLAGGVVMAAFWLGTVPVLSAIGAGARRLTGSLGRAVPLATSLAIVVVGVLSIVHRAALPAAAMTAGRPVESATIEQAVERVEQLDASAMPCCSQEDRVP